MMKFTGVYPDSNSIAFDGNHLIITATTALISSSLWLRELTQESITVNKKLRYK